MTSPKINKRVTEITTAANLLKTLSKKTGKWNKLIVVDKKGNKKQILFKIK